MTETCSSDPADFTERTWVTVKIKGANVCEHAFKPHGKTRTPVVTKHQIISALLLNHNCITSSVHCLIAKFSEDVDIRVPTALGH